MEKTQYINSRSFAGEKTPAKASYLQILKSKLGTQTRAEAGMYMYSIWVNNTKVKTDRLIIIK
jgi:hypothetical protein